MASEGKWSKRIRAQTFDDGAFVIYGEEDMVLCQRSPWPHRVEESCANGNLFGASAELFEAGEELSAAAANIHPTAPSSESIDRLHVAIADWMRIAAKALGTE